ncbi:hypothetical protein EZS27_031370, partial [termite gut metagenome]
MLYRNKVLSLRYEFKKIHQMNYQEVLTLAKSLSTEEQLQLIVSLSPSSQEDTGALRSRCAALINKQATCP